VTRWVVVQTEARHTMRGLQPHPMVLGTVETAPGEGAAAALARAVETGLPYHLAGARLTVREWRNADPAHRTLAELADRQAELERAGQPIGRVVLGVKRDHPMGGWTREAELDGVKLWVSLEVTGRARIAFKPRGANIGKRWGYRVSSSHGQVDTGRAAGSWGVRGILTEAGLL